MQLMSRQKNSILINEHVLNREPVPLVVNRNLNNLFQHNKYVYEHTLFTWLNTCVFDFNNVMSNAPFK